MDEGELEGAASVVGGLIYDLKSLVDIVSQQSGPHGTGRGKQPMLRDAADELVKRCVMELRTTALGLGTTRELDWDVAQMWSLITALAENEEIDHDRVLFSPFFNGNEAPLRAMERSGLISVDRVSTAVSTGDAGAHGGNSSRLYIHPARPIYAAAFKKMCADPVLGGGMHLRINKFHYERELAKLHATENELVTVDGLLASASRSRDGRARSSAALQTRLDFLASQLEECQRHLGALQREQDEITSALYMPSASQQQHRRPPPGAPWFALS